MFPSIVAQEEHNNRLKIAYARRETLLLSFNWFDLPQLTISLARPFPTYVYWIMELLLWWTLTDDVDKEDCCQGQSILFAQRIVIIILSIQHEESVKGWPLYYRHPAFSPDLHCTTNHNFQVSRLYHRFILCNFLSQLTHFTIWSGWPAIVDRTCVEYLARTSDGAPWDLWDSAGMPHHYTAV